MRNALRNTHRFCPRTPHTIPRDLQELWHFPSRPHTDHGFRIRQHRRRTPRDPQCQHRLRLHRRRLSERGDPPRRHSENLSPLQRQKQSHGHLPQAGTRPLKRPRQPPRPPLHQRQSDKRIKPQAFQPALKYQRARLAVSEASLQYQSLTAQYYSDNWKSHFSDESRLKGRKRPAPRTNRRCAGLDVRERIDASGLFPVSLACGH